MVMMMMMKLRQLPAPAQALITCEATSSFFILLLPPLLYENPISTKTGDHNQEKEFTTLEQRWFNDFTNVRKYSEY